MNHPNTITTTHARHLIYVHTGVSYNRQTFRNLMSVMLAAKDAQRGERGNAGTILADTMPKWIAYVAQRQERIQNGEWKSNRPYLIEDVTNE